ncbi:MAG: GAF domain-containing protein [Myxococcales bacterium]|nr:GAF domain-containing protein [Myxococcales bacterium]
MAKGTVDPVEQGTIEVLERELARSYRIERALRDVGLALGATLDIDALLRLILERTTEALEAERATLYLLEQKPGPRDGEGRTRWETVLVSRVMEGGGDEITLRLGEGIAGEVARNGQVANVRDAYADTRFSRSWDDKSGFRTRSVLCVPLKSQLGRIIGVIQVLNKRSGRDNDDETGFDEDDEALLQALATQAAVSIEQARLFVSIMDKNRELSAARGQLEKKVQDLAVLFAIERATARAQSREDLALAMLPEAARAMGGRMAFAVLADEAGDLSLLHLGPEPTPMDPALLAPPERGSRPSIPVAPPVGKVRTLSVKAGEGIVGAAIETGQLIVVDDIGKDPRHSPRIVKELFPRGEHVGAPGALVPLADENDVTFGALGVVRRAGEPPFSDDDLGLLRLIALNASTGFQLERAREARVREERLTTIGSLLSGVLHDLKTPMTVISGYMQIMASESDSTRRAEYAELVTKQFDHIAAMQREVLAFARGERSILVRRVFLQKFFTEIEAQLRHEIERRKAPVELVLDLRDRGTAKFDEAKMTRAVHNLARNALEAMGDAGGKLTLGVDVQKNELVVTVSDTGPGIPKEVETRLFQSFVTAGKAQGTGLGLAIVKKVVDDHGGTISASSSRKGTVFTLRLPQPEAAALKRLPTPTPTPVPTKVAPKGAMNKDA